MEKIYYKSYVGIYNGKTATEHLLTYDKESKKSPKTKYIKKTNGKVVVKTTNPSEIKKLVGNKKLKIS